MGSPLLVDGSLLADSFPMEHSVKFCPGKLQTGQIPFAGAALGVR
jgi:hypothetical protein